MSEVANEIGISAETLRGLMACGELTPARQDPGGLVYLDRNEVEAALDRVVTRRSTD